MKNSPARIIFFCISLLFLFIFSPSTTHASTSSYRPAGWVSTGWYSNTDGCQKTDGVYCEQPGGRGWKELFFGSFGNLDDFGIPYGSTIDNIKIRVTGRSSTTQYLGVDDSRNNYDGNHPCSFPSTWSFSLGSTTDTTREIVTPTSGTAWPGPVTCATPLNIDQENLTFHLSANAYYGIDWWSAYIDNFEIAFDYTPPNKTYADPAPSDLNGTVWQWDNLSDHATKIEGLDHIIAVSKGANHILALKNDGTILSLGSNNHGQLGTGNDNLGQTSNTPLQVKDSSGNGFLSDIKAIAAGTEYSLALANDGTVWTWGSNPKGIRGTGIGLTDPSHNLTLPAKVKNQNQADPLANVTSIAAGTDYSFALKTDGTVWGWGNNNYGKLGNNCNYNPYIPNSCTNSQFPQIAVGLTSVKQVTADGNYSLALKNDGSLWGWGNASGFQLGYAYRTSWGGGEKRQPGVISEITGLKSISGESIYPLGITNSDTVIDWQTGSPANISELQNITGISTGGSFGTAFDKDGYVYQWWTLNRNPVKIKNLSQVSFISAGNPSLAIVGKADSKTPPTPFLDLPFDYKNLGESFKDVVLNPGSWFDHKYPLQNFPCCNGPIIPYDGIELDNSYHSHNGYDFNSHNGVNYLTPVLAAASGNATFQPECGDACPLGNLIKIDHGNGYQTWYGHLDKDNNIFSTISAELRTKVTLGVIKGQKIAETGYSGNIVPKNKNGAHIHFSVFKDSNNNGNFNDDYPYGLVDPLGWEGNYTDPWTEHPNKDADQKGAQSYYLFTISLKPIMTPIPREGGTLISDDGKTEINVPKNATNSAFSLTFKDGPFESFETLGKYFESITPSFYLDALNNAGEKITQFDNAFKIIIKYDSLSAMYVKENSLLIYYFDEFLNEWTPLPSVVDTINKTVTAYTLHNSHFALMGESRDKIPPTTQVNIVGDKGNNDWYRSNIQIELIGKDNEDGIGFNETLYAIDSDNWLTYSNPLEFTKDGKYKINYQSSDKFNNVEDPRSTEFKIDKTAPNASAGAEREPDLSGWYNKSIEISFTGTDEGSGLDKCTNKSVYSNPDSDNAQIDGNCIDKAGNISEAGINFKYDSTPPTITASAASNGSAYNPGSWTNQEVTITFKCSDKTSGVKSLTDPVIMSTEGKDQSVHGECIDNAGNKSEIDFKGINIDKTAPEAKISYDLTNFDSIVSGTDNLGTTRVAVDKTKILQLKYTITDQAGNSLVINTDKVKLGKQVALTIKNLKYNYNSVISLDPNIFFTLALTDLKNNLKQLDQYYTLKDDKKIFTNYLSSRDTTKIYTKTQGSTTFVSENKPGIILLNLETEAGKLKYNY